MRFATCIAGLILCSALLFADDHSVDFDAHTDFSKLKTFALREGKATTRKPELNNRLFLTNLGNIIRDELTARGLKEAQDAPDLLVNYSIAGTDYNTTVRNPDIRIPDTPGQRGTVIPGGGPQSVRYSEGTLIIDLTSRDAGTLLWRGVYRDKESNITLLAKKLPQDAKKLLSEYPPKNKK